MPHASRSRTPKLEPEVLDRSQGSASLGGAMSPSHSIGRVSGANASQADAGDMAPLTIALPPSGIPSGAQVLSMHNVMVDVGERRLGPWTLDLRGPDRVAVVGANGAGKTTLLKIAAGLAEPTDGMVRRTSGRIAMLDQHVALLDDDTSILENFRRLNPSLGDQDTYAACARFAFRNRDALRQVGTLSGGERLRAGLVCIFAGERPPWLLILDEPTNHLDLESIELLEDAVRGFDGASLVVSHDASFLEAIGIDKHFNVEPSR